MATDAKHEHVPAEEDAPISVPDSGDTGESGKLKMIVQLVKKCLGVKDIASMRLSLPASLMEPIPNLEYWHYLDRPDLFVAINDSDDAFERMLAVIRFAFSKDLRHIRGKPCKPYNSVLGEHFRSHWDVVPVSYAPDPQQPPVQHLYLSPAAAESSVYSLPAQRSAAGTPQPRSSVASPNLGPSETASVRSAKSAKSGASFFSKGGGPSPSTAATSVESNLDAQMSSLSLGGGGADVLLEEDEAPGQPERVRVGFLTEQISHHPPISAYYAACPARGVELLGIDQISARVSGTTVKIMSGSHNKGIFVRLTEGAGKGEQYQITHPVASVNGLLRGSFYVTVGDSTIITCTGGENGQKLRTILEYKEESWIGKAHYLVEGVIHTYTEGEAGVDQWTKVKQVPKSRVLAYIDGSWKHKTRWRRASLSDAGPGNPAPAEADWKTLLDLSTLHVIPLTVRPLDQQLPNESRRLWDNVTTRLLKKEYSDATKFKQQIEQKQRDDAAERKRKGIEFVPAYFEKDIDAGFPTLTEAGRVAFDAELEQEAAVVEDPTTPKPA